VPTLLPDILPFPLPVDESGCSEKATEFTDVLPADEITQIPEWDDEQTQIELFPLIALEASIGVEFTVTSGKLTFEMFD
jgi:hypothetical protein